MLRGTVRAVPSPADVVLAPACFRLLATFRMRVPLTTLAKGDRHQISYGGDHERV
jgi:hypothetical protein